MFDKRYDPMFLRGIFEQTRILRRPVTGIVTGYHVLPYILVGPDVEAERRAVEIRGKIRVSPRLVIRPGQEAQTKPRQGREKAHASLSARIRSQSGLPGIGPCTPRAVAGGEWH